MNKAASVDTASEQLKKVGLIKTHDSGSSSDESDFDNEEDDDDEEGLAQEARALFSDKVFAKPEDVFKHEAETSGFNLISVVNNYCMGMLDYIKMINYIRKEVEY